MSTAHDFAGSHYSDVQFIIVFVTHTKTGPTESEGTAFDHGLGELFNSKELASTVQSRLRAEIRVFGQELVMFSSDRRRIGRLKPQGTS